MLLAAGLLAVLLGAVVVRRTRGRAAGAAAFAVGCAVAMVPLVGVWFPSLRPKNTRAVAGAIREKLPAGPYCFYGGNISLPLCFNLRTEIPRALTPAKLVEFAKAEPGLGVIAQTKSGYEAPKPPAGAVKFEDLGTVEGDEQTFELYRAE